MKLRSWAQRLCGAAVLLAVASFPARAHGDLKSSVPADKARVPAPRQLTLVFTEKPEMPLTRVVLRGPGNRVVALGKLTASGANMATVTAPIAGAMEPGLYTVEWEIAGEDGHPVDGKFSFTVLAPDPLAVAPLDTPAARVDSQMTHHDTLAMPTSPDRFDAQSGGFVFVRFMLYAALLVVIGAVAFRFVVLGLVHRDPGVDRAFADVAANRAATIGALAGSALLVACAGRLFAQSLALNGADVVDSGRLGTLITETNWGRGWIIQLVATMVAIGGFHLARRSTSRAPSGSWMAAGISALVLAFTPALASHAAAVPDRSTLAILADGFHVLGASGWLGSLLVVLAAGIPAAMALEGDRRGTAVADLINAFSPTALVFAGLVAATGVLAAWLHLGGLAPLWQSNYGRILMVKLAILSVVALTGAYNWLRVRPSLGTDAGAARIRRSASVEVAVGVLVLIVTAILVATPTPMDRM
jgi:copper transport protein